jgi:hypothetical protein
MVAKTPRKPPRERLVSRLWKAAEAEMTALEARLNALPPGDPSREEGAKALGLLARLVKDLLALDAARPSGSNKMEAGANDGIDLDTFRAELARKLEALESGEQDQAAGAAFPG